MNEGCCDRYMDTAIDHLATAMDCMGAVIDVFANLLTFYYFTVDPEAVPLICYTDRQVRNKLQTLAGVQAYKEVLLLERLTGGSQAVQDTQEEGHNLLSNSTKGPMHVEGKRPPDYLNLLLHDTAANRQYGLASLRPCQV